MSKLCTIIKNEFYRYFTSPIALVYLICFLFLNGACTFFLGHFFERGQADLLPMFEYIPWLFLLFVPAVAMRTWAEEFKSRTILQIITLPISVTNFVWGKFLASWLFCALAMFLTTPLWICVNFLGDADNSVILAGYLATLFLSGAMLAIAQTMSALTKNQVIALVLGVLANLLFFLSGVEFVLGNIRNYLSPSLVNLIASFSFLAHFNSFCMGLFELRDFIFFITIILLFNFFTVIIINFRTAGTVSIFKSSNPLYYFLLCLFVFFIFGSINTISNLYLRHYKLDFTEEKIFTLTESTQKVISNINGKVYAKLYYSPVLGEKNPDVRLLADRINLLLEQYAKLSNEKISIKKYNPKPFSDAEDRALAAGIQPLPIINQNQNAYLGLELTDEYNKKQVIPFFPISRKAFIEQDLTEAFYLLSHKKPRLGILTSLPMFETSVNNVVTSEWEISKQLSRFYDLFVISQEKPDLKNIDILLIAHPTNLTESAINEIKNFSFGGGKILAFFDIATEAQQLFAPTTQEFKPSDYKNLPEMWGIRFIEQAVIADLDNSSLVNTSNATGNNPEFTQDVIQFYLTGNNFNKHSPITSNLKKMMLTSASTFVPLKNANITFEPLLEASSNSALLTARAVYDRIDPAIILRNFKADKNPKYIAAHIKGSNSPLDIILVGDTDLLYDNFWTEHQIVLDKSYAIALLDNANFVLNALDVLINNHTLLALRGKNYYERKFKKLEKHKIEAAKNFRIQEKQILDNLAKAKLGIEEISQKRNFEERNAFTPDELAIIAKIRKQINDDRLELYKIRTQLNEKNTHLKNNLIRINVYMLPLLGLLILAAPLVISLKKIKEQKQFRFNKILLIIILSGVFSLFISIIAVNKYENKFNDLQENLPVFPNLANKINNVEQIVLQNNLKKLVFRKDKNGEWQLAETPHYPVYQNRIRNLLTNLIAATYYEKKSSEFESLKNFGLLPIENDESSAVLIDLQNNKGNSIAKINVGEIDVELGRGSRGAYIRSENSFQVWLAQMDLINLDLNPQNWTFSSIWNLQFGRIISVNNINNKDLSANIVKVFLNSHFIGATTELKNPTQLFSVDLAVEDNNYLTLNFYEKNNKYWVAYKFDKIASIDLLKNFAQYAKGVFYELSEKDMEKIKNATANINSKRLEN